LLDFQLIGGVVFYRRLRGRRAQMGSLIEELKRREAAARAEAGRLRSRIEELSQEPVMAEEQASRLAIACEEIARVLEEPAVAEPPAGRVGRPDWETPAASPIGAVTVPPWQEGSEASVLPQSYQDLVEVAADAGRPLRAREFAAAAGLGTDNAKVEGLRSKLKLLAARGWLAGVPGGLFVLPDHAVKTVNPGRLRVLLPKFGGATHPGPEEEEPLMAAYCAVPPDDPFAVSRRMFDGLTAEPAGPAAAALTACDLEELLDERGREVLRQLLQDHFDLRAAREER
jgi:hypothetical protein